MVRFRVSVRDQVREGARVRTRTCLYPEPLVSLDRVRVRFESRATARARAKDWVLN